jgi:nitric oxide reductase large subunit
LGLGWAHN